MGSIFRTADAAGIEKLYLCGITPTPIDKFGKLRPQLGKVSLGAEKSVAWEYFKSTITLIKKLKNPPGGGGYKIFAIEQNKKSILYYEAVFPRESAVALVLGHEVKGLPPSILKLADKILEIPMRGKKESLNVSVAFGIVVFGLLYK